MKYITNDNTKVIFKKDKSILISNISGNFKLNLSFDEVEKLHKIYKENIIISDDQYEKSFINCLVKYKIIVALSNIDLKYLETKYEKIQIYFKNKYLDDTDYISILSKNKVLFVGTGGIFSEIINQLISVGICNFVLVDYDVVNLSNFNRQFIFSLNDLGEKKTEIAKRYIINKNRQANVIIYNQYLDSSEQLNNILDESKPDFIVCSADTPVYEIQKIILKSSLTNNIACIFGGVSENKGVFGPLLSNEKSKIKHMNYLDNILKNIDAIYPCKGSFGVTNTIISSYIANDIISYFIGKKVLSLNKKIEIDFN